MTADREKAYGPEGIPRLFATYVQAGDFAGLATLHEDEAIVALPPGEITAGSQAIAAASRLSVHPAHQPHHPSQP